MKIPLSAALFQLLLCALWGLGQVAIKSVSGDISPLFHAGLRSLGASAVLLLWILWKAPHALKPDGTLGLGVIIGILFGLEFVFLFEGMMLTTASRATVLLYTSSFFVAIGSHFFLPNSRITLIKLAGLLCAFVGVILAVALRPNAAAMSGLNANQATGLWGDLFCIIGAMLWAATTLVVKTTKLKSSAPERTVLYQLGFSSIVLLGGAAIAGEAGITKLTPLLTAVLAYGILIVASASYLAWFWLISRYNPTILHTLTFPTPLFAILFGAWLLGEPIGPSLLLAAALIAVGIILVNRPSS